MGISEMRLKRKKSGDIDTPQTVKAVIDKKVAYRAVMRLELIVSEIEARTCPASCRSVVVVKEGGEF